jgi:hypothetical protein
LEEAGFIVRKEIVRRPRSRVLLILAEKPGDLQNKNENKIFSRKKGCLL